MHLRSYSHSYHSHILLSYCFWWITSFISIILCMSCPASEFCQVSDCCHCGSAFPYLLQKRSNDKGIDVLYRTDGAPLKLPSLFAVWLFWTFHNKSHNMTALVILSHSWSPFLPLTCLYGKNEILWVSVRPSGALSREKKLPPDLPMQITWPWPLVGRFNHGLITVRQKKMWTLRC